MNTTVDFESDGPAGQALAAYLNKLDERGISFRQAIRQEVLMEFAEARDALLAYFADEDRLESGREKILDQDVQHDASGIIRYVGDYALLEHIGTGGMGTVYRARQSTTGRIVAVKLVRNSSPEMLERFRREAQSIANLRHPNIVTLFEAGEHKGEFYYSMDYIEYGSLSRAIRAQRPSPQQAAEWARSIASALDYAHSKGILHRDVKPANILLDEQQNPLIADFGLAKIMQDGQPWEQSRAIVGTFAYMPPEQAQAADSKLSPASDVYSLGATLYEMLTGKPPIDGDNEAEIIQNLVAREPVSPRLLNRIVPVDLATICLKCLSKEPEQRYATAGELSEDLYRFLDGQPVKARPLSTAETCLRWGRRNPQVLSLLLTIAASLLIGTTVALYFYHRASVGERQLGVKVEELSISKVNLQQTIVDLKKEKAEKEKAIKEGERETHRRRGTQYKQTLAIAGQLLVDSPREAQRLLRDEIACPREYRDLAWRFLERLTRKEGQVWTVHAPIRAISLSPDGAQLVSAGENGEIAIWNTVDGELARILPNLQAAVVDLAWFPTGHSIVCATQDGKVSVVDSRGAVPPRVLLGSGSPVKAFAFARDQPLLAALSESGRLSTWNTTSWEQQFYYVNQQMWGDNPTLAISPNGDRAAVGSALRQIWILSLRDDKKTTMLTAGNSGSGELIDSEAIVYLAYEDDNLIAMDTSGRIYRFAGRSPKSALVGSLRLDLNFGAKFRYRNGLVAHAIRGGFAIRGEARPPISFRSPEVNSLAWSSDGNLLYTGNADQTIRIWNATGVAPTARPIVRDTTCMAMDAAGMLYHADQSGTIERRNLNTGATATMLQVDPGCQSLSVSGDGRYLAATTVSGNISLWNIKEQEQVTEVETKSGSVATFAADSRWLYFSNGSQLLCYDLTRQKLRFECDLKEPIIAIEPTEKLNLVCAATKTGNFFLIDGDSGRIIRDNTAKSTALLHHPNLAISRDGGLVATTTARGIELWSTIDLASEGSLRSSSDRPEFLAFANDSQSIICATKDGQLSLWNLEYKQEVFSVFLGHKLDQVLLSWDNSVLLIRSSHEVFAIDLHVSGSGDIGSEIDKLIARSSSLQQVHAGLDKLQIADDGRRSTARSMAQLNWERKIRGQAQIASLAAANRALLKSDAIAQIEADRTVLPEVKSAAVEILKSRNERAAEIVNWVRKTVRDDSSNEADYHEALRLAETVVTVDRTPDNLCLLSACYIRLRQFKQARSVVESLKTDEPIWPIVLTLCVLCENNTANEPRAQELLTDLFFDSKYALANSWSIKVSDDDLFLLRGEVLSLEKGRTPVPTGPWFVAFRPYATPGLFPRIILGTSRLWEEKLKQEPAFTETRNSLDYRFGRLSPGGGVPSDHFIATATAEITTDECDYLLSIGATDGMRVLLDEEEVINTMYQYSSLQFREALLKTKPGKHSLRIDYFHFSTTSVLSVSLWRLPLKPVVVATENSPQDFPPVIHASEGRRYKGKGIVQVRGRVLKSTSIAGSCVLQFGPYFEDDEFSDSDHVTIAIPNAVASSWPGPPDTYFAGKRISVTGNISATLERSTLREYVILEITDPKQIQILKD